MLALKENRSYGLSGGPSGPSGNVSVFHVKLTDSAARALGTFRSSQSWKSRPSICFTGDQGRITIPCSENGDEVRIFTFGVTNVARSNPHGSFDCVKQQSAGSTEDLSCLGVIQKKMTVNATDDSYDKARQSMAQAEEETRSRGAIVIKNGARFLGKKVTVRAPAPALAKLTKPKHSSHTLLSSIKRGVGFTRLRKTPAAGRMKSVGDVSDKPLRERVMHLLALRPYRRPEVMLRLQRDTLTDADKHVLDSVMSEVGQLSGRDGTFVLKDGLYKEVQKDWPGYSSGDQQLLKRILVRRLFQPQQNLLMVPEAQVSPLRETPNSSPAHRPRHPALDDCLEPVGGKKPRISLLSTKASGEKPKAPKAESAADDGQKEPLDPRRLFDSLTAVCGQDTDNPKEPLDQGKPTAGQAPPPLNKRLDKRKRSKHKELGKDGWREKKHKRKDQSPEHPDKNISSDWMEPKEPLPDSVLPPPEADVADYLSKYTVICSTKQRQSYKQDFNEEYSEYRDLHARIDGVTRQFMELDTQLKQLHRDSHRYKTVRNKILQEYRKIKKSNPNYSQDKARCEYLHNKLAHIKKLISVFDQQQLSADSSCPH